MKRVPATRTVADMVYQLYFATDMFNIDWRGVLEPSARETRTRHTQYKPVPGTQPRPTFIVGFSTIEKILTIFQPFSTILEFSNLIETNQRFSFFENSKMVEKMVDKNGILA